MTVQVSSKINDLRIITPYTFHDFRGEYIETFSKKEYIFADADGSTVEFVEDDASISRRGVLRGLHGDSKTWKLIQSLIGDIYVVVVDMRKDSSTYMNWEAFAVNEKNRLQILIPAGCANGHLCLSDRCLFSYKQSQYYSGMENQFTVRWDDPKLNIFWPIKDPMVSVRDSTAALL